MIADPFMKRLVLSFRLLAASAMAACVSFGTLRLAVSCLLALVGVCGILELVASLEPRTER